MNILIVDNGTSVLKELKELLEGNSLTVLDFKKLDKHRYENYDLIVLSGSSRYTILRNLNLYQDELNLIKTTNIPIIGICLGFELICYAYGGELIDLKKKQNGYDKLILSKPDSIFENLPNLLVYKAHRWAIKETPKDLVTLACSKECVEIVKHRSRKIYGFQFHPEMDTQKTCGLKIFYNLVNSIK
jgi:GMP synthase-like glutamine amidotransferase